HPATMHARVYMIRPFSALILAIVCAASFAQEQANDTNALTLRQAIAKALHENPRLSAFAWDIRAADADILQAGLRPNPELEFELEGIRLTEGPNQHTRSFGVGAPLGEFPTVAWDNERECGAPSGLEESEITLAIAHIVELGGKRAKRVALASSAKQVTLWDY